MISNLIFDFCQAEGSLINALDSQLEPRKWAMDALIRFSRIKGRVEQMEIECERLHELLRERVE